MFSGVVTLTVRSIAGWFQDADGFIGFGVGIDKGFERQSI
jgi:hypothetical protein